MLDKEYDVVVVGAGPGGSGAALTCAKSGLKTLLVEKRAEIGSPKRCGEGLSKGALERMGLQLDEKWICRKLTGATVYAPNGKSIRIDYKGPEGFIVERKIFDKWLAGKAAEAGARVLAKTEVTKLLRENGKVIGVEIVWQGEKSSVKAKVIIAADGVESKLAREAGLDTTLKLVDVASGFQFEMAGVDIDPDRIELYFGNEIAPSGYVWIFPKGEHSANIGIGVRRPWAKKTAYEYLMDFIEKRPGLKKGSVLEVNAGGVPVGGLLENMVADNFIVVGDAAHQVNPIHGGGVAEAFVGGRIAGEVVSEAFKADDFSKEFLSRYNERWWKERGEKLKRILKLRQVSEKLSDDELNWLAEYLTGEDLINFARSRGMKRLATILMKKPKLALLARKLV